MPTPTRDRELSMCFCEPVSFAAGGVLIVGGVFAGWKAFKINKRYFPVSQMPTLAGLQQFMGCHGLYFFLLADLAGLDPVQHLFSGAPSRPAQIAVARLCHGGACFRPGA